MNSSLSQHRSSLPDCWHECRPTRGPGILQTAQPVSVLSPSIPARHATDIPVLLQNHTIPRYPSRWDLLPSTPFGCETREGQNCRSTRSCVQPNPRRQPRNGIRTMTTHPKNPTTRKAMPRILPQAQGARETQLAPARLPQDSYCGKNSRPPHPDDRSENISIDYLTRWFATSASA